MNEQQGVRPTERMTYRDSTYSIVSKVAYLIGVPKRIFENQHEPPQLEIFQQLENDKNARIIRHLCIIRTAIERNFKYINDKMRTEYKTILSLPQFVPADSISQLSADNVNFIRKWNTKSDCIKNQEYYRYWKWKGGDHWRNTRHCRSVSENRSSKEKAG